VPTTWFLRGVASWRDFVPDERAVDVRQDWAGGGPSLPRAYARAVAALDWRYRTAERAHADRGAQTLHQAGRTGRVRGCRGRRDSAGVVAPIRSGGLLQFLFAPTAASYATPDGAGLRREVSHRPDAGVPQWRRQPVRHVRVCAPRPPHVPRRLCGHRALNTRDVGKKQAGFPDLHRLPPCRHHLGR
jgi:hypothetical protein